MYLINTYCTQSIPPEAFVENAEDHSVLRSFVMKSKVWGGCRSASARTHPLMQYLRVTVGPRHGCYSILVVHDTIRHVEVDELLDTKRSVDVPTTESSWKSASWHDLCFVTLLRSLWILLSLPPRNFNNEIFINEFFHGKIFDGDRHFHWTFFDGFFSSREY